MAVWNAVGLPMQRNPADDLIGPERECIRGDGVPKKIFSTYDEANASVVKGNMTRLFEAYQCSRGHWHIGKMMRRPDRRLRLQRRMI